MIASAPIFLMAAWAATIVALCSVVRQRDRARQQRDRALFQLALRSNLLNRPFRDPLL